MLSYIAHCTCHAYQVHFFAFYAYVRATSAIRLVRRDTFKMRIIIFLNTPGSKDPGG